jgi:tetratricopeptide (TPR) repeat protein
MTANNAIGRCYAVQDHLTEALQHFQATLSMAQKLDNKEYIGNAVLSMGLVYSSNSEPQKALDHFQQAKNIYETLGIPKVSLVINGIGNCYIMMKDYDQALNYFMQGIKIEEQIQPATSLLATMYANAGGASLGLKRYNEALNLLFRALKLQEKMGNISSTASTLNNIGNAYLAIGKNTNSSLPDSLRNKEINFQKALYYEKQALAVCEQLDIRDKLVDVYATLANTYRMQGKPGESLIYFDKYDALKDTLARQNSEKEFAKIEAEFKVQRTTDSLKYIAALKDQQVTQHKTERNSSIVLLSLAGIISLLLVNRQKLKQMQARKFAEAERLRAEEFARRQLADFTQSIQEKNALIEKFTAEIEKYQLQPAGNQSTGPDPSIMELQSSVILTEEQWVNFQALFEKVHTGYINRAKEKYPALTASELRFIVLSKLELSNKEMAAMLGVSLEAVRTNKHRLLKKLNLPEGITLYDTVHSI